ncbi:MAG: proton-conducting transporter membrane subunit [Desulfomicrobium sp.]|nr:proton-conducting transporter membrane subunit [Desulfomicrobium sp.]NLV96562.1 Fe-S-binding domain-containing protein [Desulfovibrionales bacterium]
MTALILIIIPCIGALMAALWPSDKTRPWLLPIFSLVHTSVCFWFLTRPPMFEPRDWIAFDPLARAVLPGISLLFLGIACYAVSYLRLAPRKNRIFVTILLLVLGLISAGHQARHLGILWVATETATLACVPLVHFWGTSRTLEATWKYLLIGGTGVALSLLGSICLGYASLYGGGSGDISFLALLENSHHLSKTWILAAWILLLVGYGTKMGLAPMHTWKPDTYGESPGLVGALLAGAVSSVAFVALLRIKAIIDAAGQSSLTSSTLMGFGLFSIIVGALFLLRTRNYKRMLAYSSIEHMGILSLAAAFGVPGVTAALFHVWSNGLTKGALFLSTANIHRALGSASLDKVRGTFMVLPKSSALLMAGMFAITACPPFAPFFSELKIILAGISTGQGLAVALMLFGLFLSFLGMSRIVFSLVHGRPILKQRPLNHNIPQFKETLGVILPSLALLLASLGLGLFTPDILQNAWALAAQQLFTQP